MMNSAASTGPFLLSNGQAPRTPSPRLGSLDSCPRRVPRQAAEEPLIPRLAVPFCPVMDFVWTPDDHASSPGAPGGACQLLFLFVVTLGRLGRRVKGHPGRVPRCFASRSSSLRAAA